MEQPDEIHMQSQRKTFTRTDLLARYDFLEDRGYFTDKRGYFSDSQRACQLQNKFEVAEVFEKLAHCPEERLVRLTCALNYANEYEHAVIDVESNSADQMVLRNCLLGTLRQRLMAR
jgi:hypothetical protein